MATPFFFFAVLLCLCGCAVTPFLHFVWAYAVGELHQRQTELHTVGLAGRHDATPQERTKLRETASLYVGHFLSCLLLETEHCPHSLPTGICLTVHDNLYFLHSLPYKSVLSCPLSLSVFLDKYQVLRRSPNLRCKSRHPARGLSLQARR